MNPRDREQFEALALRQTQLEQAVAHLRIDFRELERRVAADEPVTVPVPPPLPPDLPVFPPAAPFVQPPLMATVPEFIPPLPSPEVLPPAEPAPALEVQFGRWLARIGVVLALITLVSFSKLAYDYFYHSMGPWSKLAILAVVSLGLTVGGLIIERRNHALAVYGRTLAAGGLACLYYTLYGASYVAQLRVIESPVLGGCLLLGWSAGVLWLAERKKSELLSIFAIALAYFSSAITPVGSFTMAANLILSVTAVIFLVRNAWTGLSYLCLIGTYAGLLRQLVPGDGFEFVSSLPFAPSATYLLGAWIIYTAGIFLAATPAFVAGKRMAFLCLNNGAFIGLLVLVATLSHFGHVGGLIASVGALFLATAALARLTRADTAELAPAYLVQGLTLATGGMMIVYQGVTRGLLLTGESVFLVAAGVFSRNVIFRWAGHICGLLGTLFLLEEIHRGGGHPWMLILGGAAAMLANAYLSRRDRGTEPFVPAAAFHVALALLLLAVGYHAHLSEAWLPPALALTALGLTAAIYLVPLLELAILAQLLLVLGQLFAFAMFTDSGAWRSQLPVAAVTLALIQWWPRQRKIATSDWLMPVEIVYGLVSIALVSFALGGLVPANEMVLAFFAMATVIVAWCVVRPSAMGLRAALAFNLIGAGVYYVQVLESTHGNTGLNALGLLILLAQPALLRHWGRELLSEGETWGLILLSTALGWTYVTNACTDAGGHSITLGWGLYALGLIVIGFAANERRQRWCGLAVLTVSLFRIGVVDFWQLSDVEKVATFFVLTVICLGLSFLYYKFADRFKDWL